MPEDSITAWIANLRDGDQTAAEQLWEAYYRRLVGMARKRLEGRCGLVGDEEDVALSAFKSFCRGLEQGQFPQLADRDDLWKLLVSITLHKVIHLVRDEGREKRGRAWTRLANDSSASDADILQQLISAEPSPELAAQVAEEVDRLLTSLNDPELEELAVLKMEGYTNREIAERWQKSDSTVERKLALIRKIWTHNGLADD